MPMKKKWWKREPVIIAFIAAAGVVIAAIGPKLMKSDDSKAGVTQTRSNLALEQALNGQNLSVAGNPSSTLAINQQSGGINTTVLTNQQQINITGGNVTINGATGEGTITRLAIDALNAALSATTSKVELTREEVKLLARALSDLDKRTEAIAKLPDGRSSFGGIIAGRPTSLIDAMTNVFARTGGRGPHQIDWLKVFPLASNGIALHEANHGASMRGENIYVNSEALGALYEFGAISALHTGHTNFCIQWIDKAASNDPKNSEILMWQTLFHSHPNLVYPGVQIGGLME